MTGAVLTAWIAQGYEVGPLGYPTGDPRTVAGGTVQDFQGGTLYSHPAAGTRTVGTAYAAAHQAAGGPAGPLGYPTSGLICGLRGGGCGQVFQGGRIYSTTATGAHAVSGAIQDAWIAQGWETGALGYPTGEARTVAGGTTQDFQGGSITTSAATGTHTVLAAYQTPLQAAGGVTGPLGLPVTDLICGMRSSGCGQVFQGGRIYSTPTTG
ncbi:LGFP repeat-containing protein, partial [Klenkia terrae]